MSINQGPKVTHEAQVSQTIFFDLPVKLGVVSHAGQIKETSNHTVQPQKGKLLDSANFVAPNKENTSLKGHMHIW